MRSPSRRLAASLALRPILSVAGGFDYARPNPRILPRVDDWNSSWDLGLTASWAIWDGGRARADIAAVSAEERAMRRRLAELDSLLELEVRQRAFDIVSARAAIAAAGESLSAAQEARRVVSERFEAGVATSTDVLDAEVALLGAGLDRTRALAGLRLAEARLDRARGRQ